PRAPGGTAADAEPGCGQSFRQGAPPSGSRGRNGRAQPGHRAAPRNETPRADARARPRRSARRNPVGTTRPPGRTPQRNARGHSARAPTCADPQVRVHLRVRGVQLSAALTRPSAR
ncbi:hypothetical protein EF902_43105, partial [Streptomyces sp. WAC05858]